MEEGTVRFQHDCATCRYITSFEVDGARYDAYVCNGQAASALDPTYLARFGNEPHEYWSMPLDILKTTDPAVGTPLLRKMQELARQVAIGDKQHMRHRAAYLEEGGGFCPFCRAGGYTGDSIEVFTGKEGSHAIQNLTCPTCGATWCDVYELVDVETIYPPTEKEK